MKRSLLSSMAMVFFLFTVSWSESLATVQTNVPVSGTVISNNVITSTNSFSDYKVNDAWKAYRDKKSVIGGYSLGAIGLTGVLLPGSYGWGNFYAGDFKSFLILNIGGSLFTFITYADAIRMTLSRSTTVSVLGYIGVIGSLGFGIASMVMGGVSVEMFNYSAEKFNWTHNVNNVDNSLPEYSGALSNGNIENNKYQVQPVQINYRRSTAWLGLLAPGFPQFQAADNGWGFIYASGGIAGAGTFLICELLFESFVSSYMNSINATDATVNYNQITLTRTVAYAGIGLWALSAIASCVHAAFFGPSSPLTWDDSFQPVDVALDGKGNMSLLLSWRI